MSQQAREASYRALNIASLEVCAMLKALALSVLALSAFGISPFATLASGANPTPTSSPATRNPTLGVPIPQTQNVGPPVELDVCQPYYQGGLLIGHLAGFVAKFTNDTNLTADIVEIQILNANGDPQGIIRDVGKFAPGVEITHRYREGSGTITFSPLFSRVRVSCIIWAVHFTDGTVWRAQAQPTGTYSHDTSPMPTPTRHNHAGK
jgi:hypothetical protein